MKTEYDINEILYLPYRIKGIQITADRKVQYVLEAMFPFKTEYTEQGNLFGYRVRSTDIEWNRK